MKIDTILSEIDYDVDESDVLIESLVDLVDEMNQIKNAEGAKDVAMRTFKLGRKFENIAFAMLVDEIYEE